MNDDVILVTGAAGFVGGHLLSSLISNKPSVQIVAWRRPRTSFSKKETRHNSQLKQIFWQDVDLLDRSNVTRSMNDFSPSHVYHLAGVANVGGSWNNALKTLEVNVVGTDNLLRIIRKKSPDARILIPGSALIYQPSNDAITENHPIGPVNPYGISKLAQEILARRFSDDGLPVLLTRSFTHLGPRQDLSYAASSFAYQIAEIEAGRAAPVIQVGNLDARRDLLDVRDTVRAYQDLMISGIPGKPYNVCSGRAHEIKTIVRTLLKLSRIPISVQQDATRLRPSDHSCLLGDRERISSELGWNPQIPLKKTLLDILEYWRQEIKTVEHPI